MKTVSMDSKETRSESCYYGGSNRCCASTPLVCAFVSLGTYKQPLVCIFRTRTLLLSCITLHNTF